jgi:hypothetical protein
MVPSYWRADSPGTDWEQGQLSWPPETVSECRRSQHGDLIALQLRFYLRNIVASVTNEKTDR